MRGSETKQCTKKGESSRKAVGLRKGNWRLIRTYKLQSRGLSRVDYIGEYFRAYLGGILGFQFIAHTGFTLSSWLLVRNGGMNKEMETTRYGLRCLLKNGRISNHMG